MKLPTLTITKEMYEEVICIERNNNLDYKNDDWWKEKLLLYSNIFKS